jgi:hypothetical protein
VEVDGADPAPVVPERGDVEPDGGGVMVSLFRG